MPYLYALYCCWMLLSTSPIVGLQTRMASHDGPWPCSAAAGALRQLWRIEKASDGSAACQAG